MPQRMRYRWFVDRPRNVSRPEYDRYQLLLFSAAGLGALTFGLLFGSISGLTLSTSRDLAEIDGMTVEEALAYDGNSRDLVKIEGFLLAENPATMPDDEAQPVIRGRLQVIARESGSGSGDESDAEDGAEEAGGDAAAPEGLQPTTLLDWEETAAPVFLSDGDRQIPLAFDATALPLSEDAGDVEPEYVREGDSARTSYTVAVKYGEAVLPLPPDYIAQKSSIIVDVERAVLPQGASAVVVAGLDVTPAGNQLVDPLGDRLQISLGTEAEIREQGQQTRVMFFILAIPAGIASWFLGRSALAMRREFVERSNE
ncbi:MAG: hypothetical protein O2890_15730 [Cyanobacteria bacterium]|nr:hypothetical protein [Cyanobacteriota bacterium]MDA0867818.1 hypothetical protein [Cyanobacteriota bacterium]